MFRFRQECNTPTKRFKTVWVVLFAGSTRCDSTLNRNIILRIAIEAGINGLGGLFILAFHNPLLHLGLLVPFFITINLIRTARAEAVAEKGV